MDSGRNGRDSYILHIHEAHPLELGSTYYYIMGGREHGA